MSARPALRPATARDLDAIMAWFPDADATRRWGGPNFRYPFDAASFRADCRWPALDTYVLEGAGERLGFGQFYPREQCVHLSRLVVAPDRRRRALGTGLVRALVRTGHDRLRFATASLFVYRDNAAALACYRRAGFEVAPQSAVPVHEDVLYLTAPVDAVLRPATD